jgi:hypothetical protein
MNMFAADEEERSTGAADIPEDDGSIEEIIDCEIDVS